MTDELKQEIIKYGHLAGVKDFTPGISGNISARYGDNVIITSSGSANGYLDNDDLVVIDFDGNVIEGDKKASSEKFLHLEFYKKRPEFNCVFHVHSPYLTAFASCGIGLNDGVSPEVIYCFGEIPIAEYALPGSDELVKKTSKYFNDFDVVLMENHGVVIGAKSVKEAYLKLELAENYAKTIIFTKFLGGAKILPTEEIKKIYLLRNK